jgi:murein DD-endopeptidase MepM/ murein hydrolase activator NlpD
MAIALTWNGRADLDLHFDKFFNKDHTISAWFMPQFPDSYINPIVAAGAPVSGSKPVRRNLAFFLMGTGEYLKKKKSDGSFEESTRMFLRVGTVDEQHYLVKLKRNTWHHVAVVRSGNTFTMFLDGTALKPSITVEVKAPKDVPLRLGHSSGWRQIYEKRPAQFYGLIDDVAVFSKALTTAEIKDLIKKDSIDGTEPSLVAAWLFSKQTPKEDKLKLKFTLTGNAAKAFEAQPRNSKTDAELQPLPGIHFQFELPFKKNQLIFVGQSPFSIGGSHTGSSNFPFDFAPVTIDPTGDAVKSRKRIPGVPFTAVSDGEVVFLDGTHLSGKVDGTNSMFVSVDDLPGFYWKHLHWEKGSEKVKVGDKVKAGQVLANAGDTGVDKGNFHLHTVLVFFPDDQKPPDLGDTTTVGVPVAFLNYQRLHRIKDDNDQEKDFWEAIGVAIPSKPHLIRPGKQLPKDLLKEKLTDKGLLGGKFN